LDLAKVCSKTPSIIYKGTNCPEQELGRSTANVGHLLSTHPEANSDKTMHLPIDRC
jgi:hypothetical protein